MQVHGDGVILVNIGLTAFFADAEVCHTSTDASSNMFFLRDYSPGIKGG